MKKIIVASIALLMLTACSSVNSMQGFFDKYEKEGTVIAVPKLALKALGKLSDNEEFTKYLSSSKVFIKTNTSDSKTNRIMKDLKSSVRGENYSIPIKLNKGSNNLNVAMQEDDENVKSLVLGISGLNNVLVIQSKVNVRKDILEKAIEKIDGEFIDDLVDILK